MRLWTLHPRYLDSKGLVALWREALLARAVLRGQTTGYRQHPQLERFRSHPFPLSAINAYLSEIHAEASRRGYAFDRKKIGPIRDTTPVPTTTGQIAYERKHLMKKLASRDPASEKLFSVKRRLVPHPIFSLSKGTVAPWERRQDDS